jgi:hypothetical protein
MSFCHNVKRLAEVVRGAANQIKVEWLANYQASRGDDKKPNRIMS